MPQMSPLMWMTIFNFSILILMIMLILCYFHWMPLNLKNYFKKIIIMKNYIKNF